jgi:pimeloyl-ACP methyl ester carboxylesterase
MDFKTTDVAGLSLFYREAGDPSKPTIVLLHGFHRQPKTLVVWGRNDPLMLPAAAEFVKHVVPATDLRYFDAGHFVLDENADAVAEAIIETFS